MELGFPCVSPTPSKSGGKGMDIHTMTEGIIYNINYTAQSDGYLFSSNQIHDTSQKTICLGE
jgi:hypothetical protein